jgi:plastocyanin
MRKRLLAAFVASCGGGSSSPPPPDVAVPNVELLSPCPATVDATILDSPSTFVPAMVTIPKPGFVKFTINAEHFVIPHQTLATDPLIDVPRGQTKCLRFNASGEYNFVCGVHGFAGKIIVN